MEKYRYGVAGCREVQIRRSRHSVHRVTPATLFPWGRQGGSGVLVYRNTGAATKVQQSGANADVTTERLSTDQCRRCFYRRFWAAIRATQKKNGADWSLGSMKRCG